MSVYVDTSAFLAVLDADDENHEAAKKVWTDLLESREAMVCNSYVLVETFALVQHRLGMAAVRAFHEDVFPVLQLEWIDDNLHRQAASALLTANRRNLSLVDCASFTTMRRLGIKRAFAFDKHFSEQGFTCIPAVLT
ncbi:PIN domain-containing protein [Desulfofundulus thermobenzoicus]|uniref:Ribonuclease VapC n=1 Tax=Desulfofundulus thermobenzoicus TaxID=29376 RepID=A0A6N7IMZ1_9FIRM|nr:PIN domain-containing protein [Desulfofundulus thermobenzoicus]MQL51330.1 PIN domain-containing protein [Desulfofundulus thermobenzoicus]